MFIHSLYKGAFVNVCGECLYMHAPIITDVILALAVDRDKIIELYSRPAFIPSFFSLE